MHPRRWARWCFGLGDDRRLLWSTLETSRLLDFHGQKISKLQGISELRLSFLRRTSETL